MKKLLSILAFLALASCHKDDVDINALNTHPFDPDWSGTPFLTIDGVGTEETIPGSGLYEQHVLLTVNEAAFPVSSEYAIRMIESTFNDTALVYSSNVVGNQYDIPNYQLTLGTQYSYRLDLLIGGGAVPAHRADSCAVVQL